MNKQYIKPITKKICRGFKYSPQTGILYRNPMKNRMQYLGPVKFRLKGYVVVGRLNKMYRVHRIAFKIMGIDIPKGYEVDHINGKKHDNRWENLRLVKPFVNIQNQPIHRKGKLIGFTKDEYGNYMARICKNGKSHYLGRFKTKKEAHEAYKKAYERLYGQKFEYVNMNGNN